MALVAMAQRDDYRRRMAVNARDHAVAELDWKIIIRQCSELWEELNSLASQSPSAVNSRSSLIRPNYFAVFNHYASTNLDSSTRIRTSPSVDGMLDVGICLAQYPELSGFLNQKILDQILEVARTGVELATVENLSNLPLDVVRACPMVT